MKFIKNLLIGLSVAITVPAFAANVTKHIADQVNTYKISMTEHEQVIMKENSVIVSIDSVVDSRCPTEKLCLWQGAIIINISLLDADTNSKNTLQLFYQDKPISFKFSNQEMLLTNIAKEKDEYKMEVSFLKKN